MSTSVWEDLAERLYRERHVRGKQLLVLFRNESLEVTLLPGPVDFEPMRIPGGPASIAGHIRRWDSFLTAVSSRHYLDEGLQESAELNLDGLGSGLFEHLLPEHLRATIREWPDGTVLGISSNEDWIPWELMHDGRGFLGQRMLLFRTPRIRSGGPCTRSDATVSKGGSAGSKIILNVIGGELDGHAGDCEDLFGGVENGIEVRLLHCVPLRELMSAIGDADLIHFTCHGRLDPLRLQIYRTDDSLVNLLLDSLRSQLFHLKARCVVYANACNSAAVECRLGDFVGFGSEFYKKGASTYIGTLGTIPIKEALDFAREFYKNLRSCGGDVFRAYGAAKREAITRDPACLLFCIYANYTDSPRLALFRKEG